MVSCFQTCVKSGFLHSANVLSVTHVLVWDCIHRFVWKNNCLCMYNMPVVFIHVKDKLF